MKLFFGILIAIAILAVAASTIFYFVNIFLWPETAAEREYVRENRFYSACTMAAFIGTWFCIYKGIVPSNWIDEDIINRDLTAAALLFSFFGTLGLLSGITSLLRNL